jgi:c-di-AMP phosphodiesterase-like protein
MEQGLTQVQAAINEILNVKSLIRRKKKNQSDKKRELFISIVNAIEHVSNRQNLMYVDLQLDFTTYDESFLDIIDALVILHFGKEGAELIAYYLWDRVNPDGSINPLVDEDNNPVILQNASDLWETLLLMNPKYGS